MNPESWRDERSKLQSIIDDIERGYIRLARDQAEYLESLRVRIAHLDDKIAGADRAEPECDA